MTSPNPDREWGDVVKAVSALLEAYCETDSQREWVDTYMDRIIDEITEVTYRLEEQR